ncbi:MAG: N-acetylmuramoyl-L-alanine amidase [Sumerlaeia bacterium]
MRISLSCFAALATIVATSVSTDLTAADSLNPDPYRAQPEGALSGASIFLNPGHGWYWNDKESIQRWITQRGSLNGIIEDHFNAECVMQYLVPYLWNAGANIYTARERDLQTNEVILEVGRDNVSSPFRAGVNLSGNWVREEAPGTWNGDAFSAQSVRRSKASRTLLTVPEWPQAVFRPDIPEAGYYGVTVHYRPSTLGDTAKNVEITVNHSGGTTIWKQDQNRDGYTWKYIGNFYFEKGTDSFVVIPAVSKDGGRVVIDAVRFGGGMGSINAPDGLPSGKPRWEESGLYYTQFLGYSAEPDSRLRHFNTVRAMPLWAEWEMEPWERGNALYLSWHGNASGSTGKARGLFGFIYGKEAWGDMELYSGVPGSFELMDNMFQEIANDVRGGYDPDWRIGSIVTAWFGEINPYMNSKMPAALLEMGFFDNVEDAKYMLDPQFRKVTARGTYQGVVNYYKNEVDGFKIEAHSPEPPTHFRVTQDSKGNHVLQWRAPEVSPQRVGGDKAERYIVYAGYNGYGFDNGTIVKGTEFVLKPSSERLSHLENAGIAGTPQVFYRIAALNKGGESLPTETLAVGAVTEPASTLLVYAYDRLDAGLNQLDEDGKTQRGILSKMNTHDYTVPYARVLLSEGKPFHSTSNEAVEEGLISLADYKMVVWILGQEKGVTKALSDVEMDVLSQYVSGGGGLLFTGSEAVAELSTSAKGQQFLQQTLGVGLSRDNSETLQVVASEGQLFGGLGELNLNNGSTAGYPVQSPDVLTPVGSATAIMQYANNRGVAAVDYKGAGRVLTFGFPIEAIQNENLRHKLILRSYYTLQGTVSPLLGLDVESNHEPIALAP